MSYRTILKGELAERISRNPRYSLRAMAREADVSPALLSSVLNGKKGLSVDSAFRLCSALGFSKQKTEYFTTLLQLDSARSEELKASLQDRLHAIEPRNPVHSLSVDHFRLISEWYHFAIAELTALPDFSFQPENIAAFLGISKVEAEAAIERLERIGILKCVAGQWQKTEDHLLVSSATPSEALRKYHGQMLLRAANSLGSQTPQEKVVGSETFAFAESQLPEAAQIIDDCFQKLVDLAKRGKKPDAVYHAGIQLFRLTKKGKEI